MYSVYSSAHRHCINYRPMTESYFCREYPISQKDYGKQPRLRSQLRKHVYLLRSGKNCIRSSREKFYRMIIWFDVRRRIVNMSCCTLREYIKIGLFFASFVVGTMLLTVKWRNVLRTLSGGHLLRKRWRGKWKKIWEGKKLSINVIFSADITVFSGGSSPPNSLSSSVRRIRNFRSIN